mgnify:CR=1 FL=1
MSNRDRLTVTLGGPWRLYQHRPLPGWEMLGIVQRGDLTTGALARSATGQYAQVNAGVVRTLDQRKVKAALADS